MEVAKQSLEDTVNSPNRYTIPLFQRHYSWTKSEWEQLWDDVTEMREASETASGHFMGTLVFVPEKTVPHKLKAFQVIDGQQRLTTLSLLLSALRNRAAELGDSEFADEITETYLVHKRKKDDEYFRVYPRHRDRSDFEAAIKASAIPAGQISNALEYFASRLQQDPKTQTSDGLRELTFLLLRNLQFVHITLDSESPYRVFRSLNSTGLDLSESDLIRNFMFMHVPSDRQESFDREHWEPLEKRFDKVVVVKKGETEIRPDGTAISAFHRAFLMRDGTYIGPAATFETFERRYSAADFDPRLLTRELEGVADLYDCIRGKKKHPLPAVAKSLAKLNDLDTSTASPLVLNLLTRHQNGTLSEADLVACINALSSFVLRRYVCGEGSRTYGKWFVAACKELGDDPLLNLREFLIDKGWPGDSLFIDRFQKFDLYNSGYAKAVLRWLEAGHPNYSAKEAVDLSFGHIEVEHIMPQSLTGSWRSELGADAEKVHEQWLHTPGNLTLTGYNQEFGARPFIQKRDGVWTTSQGNTVQGYKGSNIALTRSLASNDKWTEVQIAARSLQMGDLAASIWVSA